MQLADKVIVVTGGANGIGRAMCRRFAAEKPKAVVVADLKAAAAVQVADESGGLAIETNVAREGDVVRLVEQVTAKYGRIDLFCSNAGTGTSGGVEVSDEKWQREWEVNVMAHVYAARALLPAMLARRDGYLLQTVSAAGLLTMIGSATYSATKHAALALAEWLSITHGDQGIKVSAVCPLGVRTDMLLKGDGGLASFLIEGAITPEQVAEEVVKGIAEERFLILPNPEVAEFFRRKAGDYERWLRGMRKFQATALPGKTT
ncbi:MAG TPA: SDR family oxidoreductase [Terriglobales bacterium]|jgi:NAD(P)-dependent dehydrogenase (short-subunit alcohol dehydrogenase family)|nr:SDR family oxidoreductase [Terriglobales bacterium]